jgi:hypothetical protein
MYARELCPKYVSAFANHLRGDLASDITDESLMKLTTWFFCLREKISELPIWQSSKGSLSWFGIPGNDQPNSAACPLSIRLPHKPLCQDGTPFTVRMNFEMSLSCTGWPWTYATPLYGLRVRSRNSAELLGMHECNLICFNGLPLQDVNSDPRNELGRTAGLSLMSDLEWFLRHYQLLSRQYYPSILSSPRLLKEYLLNIE